MGDIWCTNCNVVKVFDRDVCSSCKGDDRPTRGQQCVACGSRVYSGGLLCSGCRKSDEPVITTECKGYTDDGARDDIDRLSNAMRALERSNAEPQATVDELTKKEFGSVRLLTNQVVALDQAISSMISLIKSYTHKLGDDFDAEYTALLNTVIGPAREITVWCQTCGGPLSNVCGVCGDKGRDRYAALRDTRCEKEKWRLVYVNAISERDMFVLVQFSDYTTAKHRDDWKYVYASLIADEMWGSISTTGLRPGRWHEPIGHKKDE